MKTKLPESITTVDEAKVLLKTLNDNGEHFHPEDSAEDCFDMNTPEDEAWCKQASKLMDDIYNLPGNDGRHVDPMIFCPCGYLLDLDERKDIIGKLFGQIQTWTQELTNHKGDMESLFQLCVFRVFGEDKNVEAFELLAKKVPSILVRRQRTNVTDIEAILFGQAALLPEIPVDAYSADLLWRYVNFRQKHNLEPMYNQAWKFIRMRPIEFPTIRIAQLAMVLHKNEEFYSKCMKGTTDDLCAMVSQCASDYWDDHFRFGVYSANHSKNMEEQLVESLCETMLQLRYFLGSTLQDEYLMESAIDALHEKLKKEQEQD